MGSVPPQNRDAPPPPPNGTNGPPDRQRRPVALLVAVTVAAGLVGGGAGAAGTYALTDRGTPVNSLSAPAPNGGNHEADPVRSAGATQQVAAKVLPSVVSISVRGQAGTGTGSGVIVSADGLILTNNHVVEPATAGGSISVTTNNDRTFDAHIVGRDPVTDLAVVQAEDVSGLRPATLGDSADLDVGQQVVAIGSPLGLSGTVTDGIVSAMHRPVRTGTPQQIDGEATSTVIDAIQTDASINPGNSGGALVDMNGRVVGINSAIASLGSSLGGETGSIGLGFAIPINDARPIARQLMNGETPTHAFLGVSVTDATNARHAQEGALLAGVESGAAADAGLRAGDVVTRIDGRSIDSADALIAAVRSHRPGDTVQMTYIRDGSEGMATVQLGSDR